MTRNSRAAIFEALITACEFGEGWVRPAEINRIGLTAAMRLGVKRALRSLGANYEDEITMDGPVNYFPNRYRRVRCMIDADALIPIVSAASVYAKVKRDQYMIKLAKRHPRYGFDSHVGYATPAHLAALNKFGALQTVHRRFYQPVARLNLDLWPEAR